MRLIQTLLRKDTYIEKSFEIYQIVRSLVFRRGLQTEKKKFIERFISPYTENGFSKKIYRDNVPILFEVKFESRGKDGFMHFDSLQEYIAVHTRVEALSFDKLDHLFRIYFALIIVVLFVNLAHHLVKMIGIRRIKLRFRRAKRKLNSFLVSLIRKLCSFFKRHFVSLRSALLYRIRRIFLTLRRT